MDMISGATDNAGSAAESKGADAKSKLAGPKTANMEDHLDDALPPSLRTAKQITKKFGANRAAKEACLAMAGGERLTQAQKRALFRVGKKEGVDDRAMVCMVKQTDHEGMKPDEVQVLRNAAKAKDLPHSLVNGFGWMAAECAGPGTISVILEAQARLRGEASAVDVDIEDIEAVKTLRDMVLGHKLRTGPLSAFLETLTGIHDPTFWHRFAHDVLAVPGSNEYLLVVQLMNGRGVAEWSPTGLPNEEQSQCLLDVIDRIEYGFPPVMAPPPGPEEQAEGAKSLARALRHDHLDEEDMLEIFQEFDEDASNALSTRELQAVIVTLIRMARDASVKQEAAFDAQEASKLKMQFKGVLRHFQSDAGCEELTQTFDPDGDSNITMEDFVSLFPSFIRQLAGEPEPEPEPEPELEEAEEGAEKTDPEPEDADVQNNDDKGASFEQEPLDEHSTFDTEQQGRLDKEQMKAKKAEEKAAAKRLKVQDKAKNDAQNVRDKEANKAASAKAKRKKKAKKARLKKQAKVGIYDDSDGEQKNDKGILAPKGSREFFKYIAQEGQDAPQGLASTLYICVNEKMPLGLAQSLQYLVTGAELDAQDVAGILGLLSRGKKSKTGEVAAKEYYKLTKAAWAQKESGLAAVEAEFGRMLQAFAGFSGGDPLVFEINSPFGNLLRFLITESRSLGLECVHQKDKASGMTEVTVSGGAPPGSPRAGGGGVDPFTGEVTGTGHIHIDNPAAKPYVQAIEKEGWRMGKNKYEEWMNTKVGPVYVAEDDSRGAMRIKESALKAIADAAVFFVDPPPEYAALEEAVGAGVAADIAESLQKEITTIRTEIETWASGPDQDQDAEVECVPSPRGMSSEELLATAEEEMAAGDLPQALTTYEEALAQAPLDPVIQMERDKCYRRSGARSTGRLTGVLSRLARAQREVTEEDKTELYTFAKQFLSDHFLGKAGLEGIMEGNWPEAAVNQNFDKKGRLVVPKAGDQVEVENPAATDGDATDLQDEEAEEEEEEEEPLSYEELKALREEEEAARSAELLAEKEAAAAAKAEAEASATAAADADETGVFDADEADSNLSKSERKAKKKAAKQAAKDAKKANHANPMGDDDGITPVAFDGEEADLNEINPDVAQLSPRAADELRAFAKDYEPDFVEGMYTSLIEVLVAQAADCHTLPGFQRLIAHNQSPTPPMMEALHILSRRQDIDDESVDCLVWLWTGGIASCPEMAQEMIAEADCGPMDKPEDRWTEDAAGILSLNIVRATGLIKTRGKPKPFCTVRVEGHQRNTPAVGYTEGSPEWKSLCNYRVVDFPSAIVEVFIFDEVSGDNDRPMGRVTFPLNLVPKRQEFEQEFVIEPMRTMSVANNSDLGTLLVQLSFLPAEEQKLDEPMRTSRAVESLMAACRRIGINVTARTLMREAAAIVIKRQEAELKSSYKGEPSAEALQRAAFLEKNADVVDTKYDLDADRKYEQKMQRKMRQKYMAALGFCLGRFFGINNALIGVIESTVNKFDPAPEVTGSFCAVAMGTLGFPHRKLSMLKTYLVDRLGEEMERLLRAARNDGDWYTQLQKMCRNRGCAETMVDRCTELVAEANSFSTAAALFRLRDGKGAAEAEELAELNQIVDGANDDYVTAGVQNLQMMAWPEREDTFDRVRALLGSNKRADDGITGWENRAELALILKADHKATKCIKGLVAMEEFRAYLIGKHKDLELLALDKLMAGDKSAKAVMRKLTPSFLDKIENWWKKLSRGGRIKVFFMGAMGGLLGIMWIFKETGLEESVLGSAVMWIFDLILYIATIIVGFFVVMWWIMRGKPIRDKVKGPDPDGILFLQKLTTTGVDAKEKEKAMDALQAMLCGLEPNVEGKTFLLNKASKFQEKAPEGIEALTTLDYIYVLLQAGKSTAAMDGFDEEVEWPKLQDVWPPTKFKLLDAKNVIVEKVKSFVVSASIHPWMKKWAMHSDDAATLFQAVEVPLTMKPDNSEEFDALDKLYSGYRPDPAGLQPLVDVVDRLCSLDKDGYSATSLPEALAAHHRTGNIKKVFQLLDEDSSGYLDREECAAAAEVLAEKMNFVMAQADLDAAFADMDADGDGTVDLQEFEAWWASHALDKTQKRAKKLQQMEAAGMLEESPKPKELQKVVKIFLKLAPTVSLRVRTFEVLEDMCPDDETFDRLQECFHLCELKRMVLTDKVAQGAVVGLEAMCMVPPLLEGDEELGIPPNEKAKEIMEKVKIGDKAALAATEYLKQKETRRWFGMMTQRQRRLFYVVCFAFIYPIMSLMGVTDELPDVAALAAFIDMSSNSSESGSSDEIGGWGGESPPPAPSSGSSDYSNPSFYVIGLLPAALASFVNFFGQRIASLLTLFTVFFASAGTTISAAMNDGTDDFTPSKLVGVGMGCYAGGVATKVASGNIKFAYGVQGASVGAVVSRLTTFIWRPKILWLAPELAPYMEWVDLTVAIQFGIAAAWVSNTYRGLISIFATAAIGTLGFVQVAVAYQIPGMDKFTFGNIMAGGVSCGEGEDSCWGALGFLMLMLVGGTANQFKMQGIDFSLPAVTAYERFLHKVEKAMTLLFALSDFIDGANLDTGELMERCMAARDKLVAYANVITNLMHFSLCFGFAADFAINITAGIFDAVPWAGVISLCLALITPIQGGIGVIGDLFTSKRFALRLKEVKVPAFLAKNCSSRFPILGQPSFIIKFGPIGARFQQASFYLSMVNGFLSLIIVGISWLTAPMYAVDVKAKWADLSASMPDFSMEDAMARVSGVVSGLGDSCTGMFVILVSGLMTASYDLGGISYLVTKVVEMVRKHHLYCF
jgi:Ca2+-binding EF-hand superfamily protein